MNESSHSTVATRFGVECKWDVFFVSTVHTYIYNGTGYADCVRLLENAPINARVSKHTRYDYFYYLDIVMNKFDKDSPPCCYYEHYGDVDSITPLVIDMSYDCTWIPRGHCSHINVGFIMKSNIEFVVNFKALVIYCETCTKTIIMQLPVVTFDAWYVTRNHCQQNFDGNFGAMEQRLPGGCSRVLSSLVTDISHCFLTETPHSLLLQQ